MPACGVTPLLAPIGQSQMTSTLAKEAGTVGEFSTSPSGGPLNLMAPQNSTVLYREGPTERVSV